MTIYNSLQIACFYYELIKILGEGNGNPLQYSCLGNPTDRGAVQQIISTLSPSLNRHQQLLLEEFTEPSE